MIGAVLEHYEKDCTVAEKDKIKIINLNYRDISGIGYIHPKFHYVEELYLNHNMLEKLNGIEQFPFLKVLSVKFNMISNIEQFFLIMNKKNLFVLNLLGNPVEKDERCKVDYFLRIFPNLKEFNDRNVNQTSMNGLKTMKFSEIPKLNFSKAMPIINDLTNNNQPPYNNTLDKRQTIKPTQQIQQIQQMPVQIQRSKSTVKTRAKPNLTQDMGYMLKDIDKYGDETIFENQRTATFKQMQKYNLKLEHQTNSDEDTPISTDRFGYPSHHNSQQNFYQVQLDQSITKSRQGINGKSVDVSLVRYSPNRSSIKPASGHKRTPFAQLSNVLDVRGKLSFDEPVDASQYGSNLFDKHIINIDKDIEQLAVIFHSKALKEKTMKAIKLLCESKFEANNKADQFYVNWKTIQVFYAWLFYFNTNKRKTALIRTINESKAEQFDYPQTHRNPSVNNNKKKTYLHYSDGKSKEQQFGYYYA